MDVMWSNPPAEPGPPRVVSYFYIFSIFMLPLEFSAIFMEVAYLLASPGFDMK